MTVLVVKVGGSSGIDRGAVAADIAAVTGGGRLPARSVPATDAKTQLLEPVAHGRYPYRLAGGEAVQGGDLVVEPGDDALDRLLARSDHLVLTAPATADTRGLIDAGAIQRMRSGAVLINVSRGDLVDPGLRAGRAGRMP